jgi:hypothetical protein
LGVVLAVSAETPLYMRQHGGMTGEDENKVSGFLVAPWSRAGAAGALPAKIELNIVREMPNPFAGLSASWSRGITAQIAPVLESMAATWVRPFAQAFSLHLDRMIPRETFERLREALPPNWVAIEDSDWDVDWTAALETMNEGIPLIWVPGPAIVGRLLTTWCAIGRLGRSS